MKNYYIKIRQLLCRNIVKKNKKKSNFKWLH